ncbi:hypothetical protein [Beihai weivirus-like virus 20]|uniref:hypothetical protein n=1 Tax=Beihai weivirus-like virus 20 TaxID=1922749 RepID=UPI00090CD429|nr:hypothetical protein [Beihai weivirus-like virus 20]APG78125.1 hypothetical protein [Beihai weivirus-like virus 20]
MAGKGTRKNGNNARRAPRRQGGRAANRSTATRVLATGVGASVPKPFGSRPGQGLACWDAKHPSHLALPRAVGPYTTVRATRRVQLNTHCNVIGTFQEGHIAPSQAGDWSEVVLVADVTATNPINGHLNTRSVTVDLSGLGDAATLVPSALSVQVMCPTALQTASGIIYAGVMNTQAALGGRVDSWDDWCNKFVQFQSPRLLAASKLALRGIQINSYPLNMTEVSKFTPLRKEADLQFEYTDQRVEPTGWAPIVIYNPEGTTLELLITVEYRVRFDLDHPASASHTHHPVASDSTWDRMVRSATALGNGVMDIADVVANTGMAVGRAAMVGRALTNGAARALPALTM